MEEAEEYIGSPHPLDSNLDTERSESFQDGRQDMKLFFRADLLRLDASWNGHFVSPRVPGKKEAGNCIRWEATRWQRAGPGQVQCTLQRKVAFAGLSDEKRGLSREGAPVRTFWFLGPACLITRDRAAERQITWQVSGIPLFFFQIQT